MCILDDNLDEFWNFPESLRKLVEDELKSGNQVIEFGHGFPAAPCGAYIKLASEVSTRKHEATADLYFYDSDSSNYSGEFTDRNRHFFVLEPPHPPKQEPDMQAIREAIDAEYATNDALQTREFHRANENEDRMRSPGHVLHSDEESGGKTPASIVQRFVQSMEMNYDKWREGEGYDLTLIQKDDERSLECIEKIVIQHSPRDWRDIEALAMIDSPKARAAIMDAFLNADTKTRMAIHSYAPELLTVQLCTDSIIQALRESTIYYGLSETLNEIEEFHPPTVIKELVLGLMSRDGATACHFAAMLYYLNGKASSAFDWKHRPFFLRFNTDDLSEREVVVRELCEVIGVDPTTIHRDWLPASSPD